MASEQISYNVCLHDKQFRLSVINITLAEVNDKGICVIILIVLFFIVLFPTSTSELFSFTSKLQNIEVQNCNNELLREFFTDNFCKKKGNRD